MAFAVTLAGSQTNVASSAQSDNDSAAHEPAPQGMTLNLVKAFYARSAWRLVVTEAAPVKDYQDDDAPGALTLCLRKGPTGPCISDPVTPPLAVPASINAPAWEPHYVISTKIVYPHGPKAAPFLEITTGSLNSGDGNQLVYTQLLKYDDKRDEFRRIYIKGMGHNNNEEIRFIAEGPLQGDVISAAPQHHLPYGYWIVVNRLTLMNTYSQVLRYRSATLYNDGNSLAVIDSEMPNIERRLGLWKPGDPIPVPDTGRRCLKPILRHTELWCD
ncbi:MAG TPA: hypothetical protein VMH86_16915 [Rhizomicrobium sp.]|nr:hypothetical protein [Rhizomicrobium sp.]